MAEVGPEAPAPGAVRVCRICVDFLRSPAAAVEPCGHVFCHACIQHQAGHDAAAACPICQGPIGAIRLLQGLENRAGRAPRRPRRLHPFVLRWRQQQELAAPGGGRGPTFSDGDRAPSAPGLHQRVQRELEGLDRNGPGQEPTSWTTWGTAIVATEGAGEKSRPRDHVHLLPLIPSDVDPPWPL